MTLAKRLGSVEDNHLTPLEAVLLWMGEAHAFGSLENYFRWLTGQPDDAYPLIRMPRQVVEAVRRANKGRPHSELRGEFLRVQRDVLFLYFLHDQLNTRELLDREALSLRAVILIKEFRALTMERHALDQMRLDRLDLEGQKHPRPGKVEKTARARYDTHAASWLPQVEEVRGRILEFLSAAQVVSRRYFAGADVLYPETRAHLSDTLEAISSLEEMHAEGMRSSPASDPEFRDYMLNLLDEAEESEEAPAPAPANRAVLEVTGRAKALAEQWVLMARSEALDKLGEHREAERVAERLVREYMN